LVGNLDVYQEKIDLGFSVFSLFSQAPEKNWGSFAIIQEVSNDPCAGAHGVQYHSPVGPGFGKFK